MITIYSATRKVAPNNVLDFCGALANDDARLPYFLCPSHCFRFFKCLAVKAGGVKIFLFIYYLWIFALIIQLFQNYLADLARELSELLLLILVIMTGTEQIIVNFSFFFYNAYFCEDKIRLSSVSLSLPIFKLPNDCDFVM